MDIVEKVIKDMIDIEQDKSRTGEEKKKLVIKKIKDNLDYDPLVEDIFGAFIDYIILVDKGEIKINPKVNKIKNYFSCIC